MATHFTIEVYYTNDAEDCRYVLRNMTAEKLKEFREVIVTAGLMLPVARDPGTPDELDHWRIILPHSIKSIDVWRQRSFIYGNKVVKEKSNA